MTKSLNRIPKPDPSRDGIWTHDCIRCGTNNPTPAGVTPDSCAGCGAKPFPALAADRADYSAWMTTPEDQDRIDRHAAAKREERAERLGRLARAALSLRIHK